jgi:hypothetical protein
MPGRFEINDGLSVTENQPGQPNWRLFEESLPSNKAPIPTHRDVPVQTAPSSTDRSVPKSQADISAKIRENLEPCNVIFALDAAKALDENNRPEAQRLLNECGLGNPAFLQDLKAVQDFALAVDDFDNKNEGLNLNLKWKLDSTNVYNLDGMEIGEANW